MELVATGVGVKHGRQWVFRDLDLTVQAGQLAAVTGPHGSGRTSALLALTGHLKHTHGTVTLHGKAALGLVRGVHEPEAMLTAREHLGERARLLGRRFRRAIPAALPFDANALARDLSPLDRHLLMIEMAALSRPDLIAVDDLDLHLSEAEQKLVIEALQRDGRAALIAARSFPDSVELSK